MLGLYGYARECECMKKTFAKKVVRIAQSHGVIIPADIMKELNIKKGDYVKLIIEKVE